MRGHAVKVRQAGIALPIREAGAVLAVEVDTLTAFLIGQSQRGRMRLVVVFVEVPGGAPWGVNPPVKSPAARAQERA